MAHSCMVRMHYYRGGGIAFMRRMRKGIIISTTVLLLVIVLASMLWILAPGFAPGAARHAARSLADNLPRSNEVPLSSHRAFSSAAVTNATTYEPWGIAFDYVHGFVWLAEPGCEPTPKCPTKMQGAISQYALADGSFIQDFQEPVGYTSPLFLAVDASGNLWFTEFAANRIGFFNPRAQTLVESAIPTPDSQPYGITLDPRGNVWFTENRDGLGQIGSFTPSSSGAIKITEHAVNAIRPHLIVADSGGNIWYSDGFSGHIGKFDPRSGASAVFHVYFGACTPTSCTGTHISGIAADSQGRIWFTDSLSQRIGYLIPSSGQVVARTLKYANAHPNDGLAVDREGRVWFTEQFAHTLTMWPASAV